ncbi:MAG TPA: hypothetical protein VE714_11065 [Gemmatimonadales bacterium]|nr:hypothetical protein [Gemmatimonadales bacterium]
MIALGLLVAACAGNRPPAALGWSLGGEAHVFVTGDRFARDLYHQLTGRRDLSDSLRHRPLVAVEVPKRETATVLSMSGAAPARLTLARFHAPERCGTDDVVTELVLAFPPGGSSSHSAPRSNVTVVALLDGSTFAGEVGTTPPPPPDAFARELVTRVADRAESQTRGAPLGRLHRPVLDADQSADAGEVVALDSHYAVGFRVTFAGHSAAQDTVLITGVATTDSALRALRWVVPPRRLALRGGMIVSDAKRRAHGAARYSLRGAISGPRHTQLLLLDEITDVSARDARAIAVDGATGRIMAAQPLALHCP